MTSDPGTHGALAAKLTALMPDRQPLTSAELMVKACAPLLKRHLLMFLIHRDEELESLAAAEPLSPEDVTRAVAAQALLRERAIVAARLKRMGVHVVEASHEGGGSALVEAYLMLKRQRLL